MSTLSDGEKKLIEISTEASKTLTELSDRLKKHSDPEVMRIALRCLSVASRIDNTVKEVYHKRLREFEEVSALSKPQSGASSGNPGAEDGLVGPVYQSLFGIKT